MKSTNCPEQNKNNPDDSLIEIQNEIAIIKQRNVKVEIDKAWETSCARRGLLTILTYLAIALYLSAININWPWLNAIVPAIGFMLSTLTLPFFKSLWLKYYYKK